MHLRINEKVGGVARVMAWDTGDNRLLKEQEAKLRIQSVLTKQGYLGDRGEVITEMRESNLLFGEIIKVTMKRIS